MEELQALVEEMEIAKLEGDKFYINENLQAGKRYFASLMNIERKCKAARVSLSKARAEVRERRGITQ